MAGRAEWEVKIDSNVEQLLGDAEQLRSELNDLKNKKYKIDLDIDSKKLENVITKLDKMLDNLGKGTNDFNQFKELGKYLNNIASGLTDFKILNSTFLSIESHLNSLKSTISDVGNGQEFSPLLKMINDVKQSIVSLEKTSSKMKLDFKLDLGSNETDERKVQKITEIRARQLEGYRALFGKMKFSGFATTSALNFYEPDGLTIEQLISLYKQNIKEMNKNHPNKKKNNDILSLEKEVKNANNQFNNATRKIKTDGENPIENLFGKTDLSPVLEQLKSIELAIKDISVAATGLKEALSQGLNVSASIDEITKLTNRVKELEQELNKIKTNSHNIDMSSDTSNIHTKNVSKQNLSGKDAIKSTINSAKELDNVLEKIDIPTESFDDILSKLNLAESKLSDIVKITQQAHTDGEGKFYNSYTLTDKYGSSEIYGESSQTDNGQLLKYNYIKFDKRQEERTIKQIVDADNQLRKLRDTKNEILQLDSNASTKNIDEQIFKQKEYIKTLDETNKSFVNQNNLINARKKAKEEYNLNKDVKQEKASSVISQKEADAEIKYLKNREDKYRQERNKYIKLGEKQAKDEAKKQAAIRQKEADDEVKYLKNREDLYQESRKKFIEQGNSQQQNIVNKDWDEALKVNKELQETENLIRNLNSRKDISTDLSSEFNSIKQSISSLNKELQQGIIGIDDYKRKVSDITSNYSQKIKNQENEIKKELNSSKIFLESNKKKYKVIDKSKPEHQDRNPEYAQKINEYKQAISNLEVKLDELSKKDIVTADDINGVKKLKENIEGITISLGKMSASEKGTTALSAAKQIKIMTQYLNKFTGISKDARHSIEALIESLKFDRSAQNVAKVLTEFTNIGNAERLAGREVSGLKSIINEKFRYGLGADIAAMFGFNDIINAGKSVINNIREIDTATTELRKVSDATDARLAINFENSATTAKDLGSSISDIISATSDWSKMGYDIDQAEELARVSTLYKNVGDGLSIDDANSSLISTLQGFQLDVSEAESIIDKFNEVSNNYSIDSAGIGEALKRSAASFNAANTDLSKSIALITATNEVVQNPESVGTLWKTLSARIRGADTELKELGEDTDEYTESTSKLRDLIKGMTGFDIMKDDNTFKDIYEIILGIGKEWNNLTDIQQASLGEALAGKRNANALYAVLGNIETLESAYQTAENSAGSAMREQENWEKSIQFSMDRLSASTQEWSHSLVDSGVIKWFVDTANAAVELSTALGPLKTISLGIGAALGFKNVGRLKKQGLNVLSMPTIICVL